MKSSIPVKNNRIGVCLNSNQDQLTTASKWERDSASRVYNPQWSRLLSGQNISECTYLLIRPVSPRFIIVRERSAEHEACNALKQVDPLFKVALLTIDLQHSDRKLTDVEVSCRDPFLGGMTDVLRRRNIILRGNSLRLCEIATRNGGNQHKRQSDAWTAELSLDPRDTMERYVLFCVIGQVEAGWTV